MEKIYTCERCGVIPEAEVSSHTFRCAMQNVHRSWCHEACGRVISVTVDGETRAMEDTVIDTHPEEADFNLKR